MHGLNLRHFIFSALMKKRVVMRSMMRFLSLVLGVMMLMASPKMAYSEELSAEASLPVEQWDLYKLPADWWRVFQSDDQAMVVQRLLTLKTKVSADLTNQPPEVRQSLANVADSFTINADAYVDLRQKNNVVATKSTTPKDSYRLADWLDIMQAVRNAQHEQQDEQDEVTQVTGQLAAIAKEADDVSARYLTQTSEPRLPLLLNMVERRFAWFVANESLRLQRQRLANSSDQLAHTQQLWTTASKALQLDDKDYQQLKAQLALSQQQLEKQVDAFRAAQASAVLVWGNDEMSRAKGQLQQVKALGANIDVLMANIAVQWNERLFAYVGARQQVGFDWEKSLRDLMPQWQNNWHDYSDQRKSARGQLENRREQVQSALLQLSDNPPAELSPRQLIMVKQQYQQAIQLLSDQQALLKSAGAMLQDSETLAQLQIALLLQHDGVWRNRWHAAMQVMSEISTDVGQLLTASLFKVGDTPVTTLGLIRVVVFITLAWWISYWLRKGLIGVAARNDKIARHTAYTLSRLIHYVIMIIGVVVALSSVGIDFSSLAWIAGALSVGIGFGLQDVVKNFVAGLIVMFEKTLKVGDFIELPSGISGTVKEISLRSTLITTGDNLEVVIPNAEFTSGRVVNWTLSDPYRRVHIPFSVALHSDKKVVVDAVLAAARQVPYTIFEERRQPQVVLGSLDGKMSFELLVWIKQGSVQHAYGVKASYLWQIESALRNQEIELV